MTEHWTWQQVDETAAAELRAWLPERAFDVHAHLYLAEHLKVPAGNLCRIGPAHADVAAWRTHLQRQLPGTALEGGLFFPFPAADPADIPKANDFLLEQLRTAQDGRGLLLVDPDYDQARLDRELSCDQVAGFKVYHIYSRQTPTFDAPIEAFLPTWVWQRAHERGLIIMLHLVRRRALADEDNQACLARMCRDYPNAKLVLAHAARSFHGPDARRGLPALRGLENVWFDTSAICEPEPLCAILESFGPRKLLWGSDFPVSELRGRCVTVGDGFAWLQRESVQWEQTGPGCAPLLVGLESLRALRLAADIIGLNRGDIQGIFSDNARRLLGMEAGPLERTQRLYDHARQRIPGGTQLLSKRPEMMAPRQWPAYFREARGCEVWDLDGRHYFDMSTNGIGSCLLGFRDDDVTRAVRRRLTLGSMSTLNPPEEVELADRLCELHPWAQQARFTRTGGEAMAVAVRIARATTGRSAVAVCGYHGWHDWYLAANLEQGDRLAGHLLPGLEPAGVPAELGGTAFTFKYNDLGEFQRVLGKCGHRLAAVVMEPCRYQPPADGFLETIRAASRDAGALLVFDEITIGWRLGLGGAHLRFGVTPDLAVFAKALGNGHPIGAVIGTRAAMGGAHESFISSTYWTESIGPTAALATLGRMQQVDVPAHIAGVGEQVRGHWRIAASECGLPVKVAESYPCLVHFAFQHDEAPVLMTYFTQLMLERGFLAGAALYPTLAHTDEVVEAYGVAIREVFASIREALDAGQVRERLKGPAAHAGFRRLT